MVVACLDGSGSIDDAIANTNSTRTIITNFSQPLRNVLFYTYFLKEKINMIKILLLTHLISIDSFIQHMDILKNILILFF